MLETLAETVEYERALWDLSEFPLSARVLRSQESVQVMVGDPEAEPSEVDLLLALGYGSLLLVPILRAGQSVGVIEAYSRSERPWTRADISRARIISNQFAPLIEDFAPDPERNSASES
jgi:GAF domain-containing protein